MMTDWSKYPFVRMLVPLALGIWISVFFSFVRISNGILIIGMLALFAMALVAALTLKRIRLHWLFGAIMGAYLIAAGFALTRCHEAASQKDFFRLAESKAKYYVARVYEYPTERDRSVRMVLQLEHQFGDGTPSCEVNGKVMAYFEKTDAALALQYGDIVAFPAPIGEVAPPKNPEEFDYKSYLEHKGVTGQVYLKEEDWLDLQQNNANPVYAFSYRFRDVLMTSLQRCGVKDKEFGVAAAILLGYDEYLADEVRKNYVAAGSMHILCVSGLHVGIIYLLASFLLGFLKRKKWQKDLKQVLLLFLIWFYALIAGLSPSILRATLMISFVIVGELIRRKGFAINSIAASAFILLCVNPYNLFEIGFQLSYAAVIGIVILQKPIYGLLYLKNKLLDRAWEITSVALAAQLATIPFTVFYFHQFTSYFWLSNLFLTPISFVVVMGGMLLLLVSWIPYVNVFFGYLVWGAIFVMNAVVSWVEGLPFSIIKGLFVSPFEFFLLLTAFLLLLLCVAMRRRRLFIAMLSVLLVFMVSVTLRLYRDKDYQAMTFYSLRQHTAVDFIKDGQHVLLADSALMHDPSTVDYSLSGNWTKRHLSQKPEVMDLDADFEGTYVKKKSNLVSFGGKLLALWDGETNANQMLSYRIPVDYMLVRGRQRPDLQSVMNSYEVGTLLIDATVPHYLTEKWETQARSLDLPYYSVAEGAYETDLTER